MTISASIPKLVSTKVLMTLQNNLVAKQICTMDTGSQIKKQGDTVTFPGLSTPTISPYSGTITPETLNDAGVTLLIDQQNYYSFYVDDIESFQSVIDVKGTAVEEAAYGLLNTADKYVLGLYAGAGTTITATVSETIALSTTSTVIRKLTEANVKPGQRWLVIPPWYAEKLELAGIKFSIKQGTGDAGDGIEWAKHLNTDIYVSNNLATTGAEGSYNTKCLAGSYNSIVYAEQILKSRVLPEVAGSFAAQCDGLHVFGAKVIKPKELVQINATQAAASSTI
ncbi:hypothetical protein [Dehalobacter restrictus]|uniref:Uncharacterized protein n=1 Tax=Dehalobacter restrictus TaxID=55583 RepID=A0A857DFL3_9FIRM|nr:hypothetical protein [Dehalobacter restrictus]QGZ99427.1 hypothetical protein GQ588_01475 [Dehalobacter restrictus]